MSSIPFERYDDEFESLMEQVRTSLQSKDVDSIKYTASLLSQCDDLLKQMSVEARGVEDATSKRDLLAKVRNCKSKLTTLKEQHDTVMSELDRESLLAGGGGDGGVNQSHKQRLLSNEKSLEKQNSTLENARRVMAETEETAMEISTELGRNRETLSSAHGRVHEVSGLTNRARRILQSMSRRAVQQRLAVYSVGFVIVFLFLVILWKLR